MENNLKNLEKSPKIDKKVKIRKHYTRNFTEYDKRY